MSAYFTTDMFNIVTSKEKRDEAVMFLSEGNIYDVPRNGHPTRVYVDKLGNGKYLLTPEWNPFSGCWSNSGPIDEIEEFLKAYCEPGSFISQRCDDYFDYSIFYLDGEREVQEECSEIVNPFIDFAEKLCKKSEA